jgi:predicted nucleotidyltransferase
MTSVVPPNDVLATIVGALENASIRHMLVGSFASTLHGADRSTQDIDILIDPTPARLKSFTDTLAATDMYVSPSAQEALKLRDQFNVISPSTGWKIDLIMAKEREFDQSRLERRKATELFGVKVWVSSAEDTILAKLEWARMGGSDRQMEDVSRMLDAGQGALDTDYLTRWASALEVSDLLENAQRWGHGMP